MLVMPFFRKPSRLWLSMRRMPEATRNSGVTLAARLAHAPSRFLIERSWIVGVPVVIPSRRRIS
jgi:hypothetical protein